MPEGTLAVLVQGQQVGVLSPVPPDRIRFVPDSEWLSGGQKPRLGLSFLANPAPREGYATLPPWFENLLPELGSPLRTWMCRQHGIDAGDTWSLLGAVGRDLPGAVEITGDTAQAGLAPPTTTAGDRRFSLAGMQLKQSMVLQDETFVLPEVRQLGQWIVKFASDRLPEVPEVEFATMSWAQAIGISIPEIRLISTDRVIGVSEEWRAGSATAFAIRRFDRDGNLRIHQEDLAQALECRPSEKYGCGNKGVSYNTLTNLVGDVCGTEDQEAFVERLAFLVACGNDDAHLKNWSLQWSTDHGASLSPAYDLVSTISWPDFGWNIDHPNGPKMAMALGKRRWFQDLDEARLRTWQEKCGMPGAVERFLAVLKKSLEVWPLIEPQAPVRMREAVREHWKRVPILKQVGPMP